MESQWMGRYRKIVAALVLHGNVVARTLTDTLDIGEGIMLKHQQWQILEYIVENQSKHFSMIDISYRLNIPQSTFSKTVKLLCEHGLVEKYQAVNNHKNIILQPTQRGLQLYEAHIENTVKPMFQPFFDSLKDISTEEMNKLAKAIEVLDNSMLPERHVEVELVKIEG